EGLEELFDFFDEPVRQVERDAADPEVVVEEAGAAAPLEEVQDALAVAEAVEEGREGADVEAVGADGDEVGGDAVELRDEDAEWTAFGRVLTLGREPLDRQREAELVVHRGKVVHAV